MEGKEHEAAAHKHLHSRSREPWALTKLALSINFTLCSLDLANTLFLRSLALKAVGAEMGGL